jgi:hypothetical protein
VSEALELYRKRSPRTVSQALARVDDRKLVARAADQAEAELAAGRISDLTKVTRHGLAAGATIALDTELATTAAPWATPELVRIARRGMQGTESVITDLADGR